jgi:hypothetical protein
MRNDPDWYGFGRFEEHGHWGLQGVRDPDDGAKGGVGVAILQRHQGALAHPGLSAELIKGETQGLPSRADSLRQRNCAILYHH